ncbi:MAG: rhomboid family intramembrane serine protease [Flavobacterium sp.]|nr:rhomboid family intramembrane serine protease [Flavobacterium sp.]
MSVLEDLKLQYKMGSISIRLVFWNVTLFVVPEVVFAVLKLFNIKIQYLNFVSVSSSINDLMWKPWSMVSYSFFHSGIMHLLFNMLMLYYVGRLFITFFTQKQLLGVYLLGAIFSSSVFIVSYAFLPALTTISTQMIGASGSVMAILFATTSYQPYMEVHLFGVFKMRLWHIAFILVFFDLIQLPLENTGGHLAHIGGAVFGYIYIFLLKRGTDLTSGINSFFDFMVTIFSKKQGTKFKKVYVNPKKPAVKRESKIVTKDKTQQQIDEILDKISKSGYDSLTKDEKEFLFNSGK